MKMQAVLDEVKAERIRQDAKWGQQDHHDSCTMVPPGDARCSWHGVPSLDEAKRLCDGRFRSGEGGWSDILVEEVSEAVAAMTDAERRAELIQVAAVAVAWIEAIDRRQISPTREPFSARLCHPAPFGRMPP